MKKALTGIASFIPLVALIGIVLLIFSVRTAGVTELTKTLSMVSMCVFVVFWIMDYIIFVPDALNNRKGADKMVWIFLLLIFSALVFPIYWLMYYRKGGNTL